MLGALKLCELQKRMETALTPPRKQSEKHECFSAVVQFPQIHQRQPRAGQGNKKGNMKKYERCLQQSRWLGEPDVPAILTAATQRQKGGGGI